MKLNATIFTNDLTGESYLFDKASGQGFKREKGLGFIPNLDFLNDPNFPGNAAAPPEKKGWNWGAISNTFNDIFGIIQSGAGAWSAMDVSLNPGSFQFGPGNNSLQTPPPVQSGIPVELWYVLGGLGVLTGIYLLVKSAKKAS